MTSANSLDILPRTLAVRIGSHGWALALTIQPTMRTRLAEHVYQADTETMEHVDAALRAVLDL